MRSRVLISILLPLLVISGCDSADVSEWAAPEIRVTLVNPTPTGTVAKSSALLRVELQVRSQGGRDFSPEAVTVDNNSTSEVVFEVSIPPDSLYTFAVRFTNAGNLVGEGATLREVTLETTVIDISVLETSTTIPSIAFFPSDINTSVGGGTIGITLRLYGVGLPAAGVAALFDITGPTARPFVLEGSDNDLKINFVEGDRLNAAWQFAQEVQGVKDIGVLRIQRNQTANYCIEADEDNIRIVDRDGAITLARLMGACVTVTP
ncbi:MAG TPA: hypothetical protein VMO47_14815 [Rhodothermales bacterium]|nr:hypothetical protein [Rhodothermales bacterium]